MEIANVPERLGLLSLPTDILLYMQRYELETRDLASLLLTCRTVYTIFIPCLYSTVNTPSNRFALPLFRTLRRNPELAKLVTRLTTAVTTTSALVYNQGQALAANTDNFTEDVLAWRFPRLPNCTGLRLNETDLGGLPFRDVLEIVINCCPTLKSLGISRMRQTSPLSITPSSVASRLPPSLIALEVGELLGERQRHDQFWAFCRDWVQDLTLYNATEDRCTISFDALSLSFQDSMARLRSLTIRGGSYAFPAMAWNLPSKLPTIKVLRCAAHPNVFNSGSTSVEEMHLGIYNELDRRGEPVGDEYDSEMVGYLSDAIRGGRFPRLRKLVVRGAMDNLERKGIVEVVQRSDLHLICVERRIKIEIVTVMFAYQAVQFQSLVGW